MAKTNVGPLARSSRWRLLLLVVFLGLVAYVAIGDGLIFAVWEQEQKLEALQVQVHRLEAENDSLQGVLEQLDSKPGASWAPDVQKNASPLCLNKDPH